MIQNRKIQFSAQLKKSFSEETKTCTAEFLLTHVGGKRFKNKIFLVVYACLDIEKTFLAGFSQTLDYFFL